MRIKHLQINTYKGLIDKSLDNFGDVNIIVGDNNTCKTTFLEAIKLVSSRYAPLAISEIINNRIFSSRINESFQCFIDLFNQSIEPYEINISSNTTSFMLSGNVFLGEYSRTIDIYDRELDDFTEQEVFEKQFKFQGTLNGMEYSVKSQDRRPTFLPSPFKGDTCQFIYADSHLRTVKINDAITDNILEDDSLGLIELLKCFDSNIENILFVSSEYSNQAILKIKHTNKGFISLSNYGDGIKKVILLASSIIRMKKGGIILIDEIETSLHVSALENVFSWLIKVCKERNIQLFVTTHSREALKVLINQENGNTDTVVYKLENFNDDIYIDRIDAVTAHRILSKGGDLR